MHGNVRQTSIAVVRIHINAGGRDGCLDDIVDIFGNGVSFQAITSRQDGIQRIVVRRVGIIIGETAGNFDSRFVVAVNLLQCFSLNQGFLIVRGFTEERDFGFFTDQVRTVGVFITICKVQFGGIGIVVLSRGIDPAAEFCAFSFLVIEANKGDGYQFAGVQVVCILFGMECCFDRERCLQNIVSDVFQYNSYGSCILGEIDVAAGCCNGNCFEWLAVLRVNLGPILGCVDFSRHCIGFNGNTVEVFDGLSARNRDRSQFVFIRVQSAIVIFGGDVEIVDNHFCGIRITFGIQGQVHVKIIRVIILHAGSVDIAEMHGMVVVVCVQPHPVE